MDDTKDTKDTKDFDQYDILYDLVNNKKRDATTTTETGGTVQTPVGVGIEGGTHG